MALFLIPLTFTACGDPSANDTDDSATGEDTAQASETSETNDTSDTGEESPGPVCGDGVVEGDEACEPSEADPESPCTDDCQLHVQDGWTTRLDGVALNAVAVADDGRVFAAGRQTAGLNDDLLVQLLEPDGSLGWTYTRDTDSVDLEEATDIGILPSGDIVVTGIMHEHEFAFSEAAYVLRLDAATGERVWQTKIGKIGQAVEARSAKLAVDAAGEIAVVSSEQGQGDQKAVIFSSYSADGDLLRRNERADVSGFAIRVIASGPGTFAVLSWLDNEAYVVRPDEAGDFVVDESLAGTLLGTHDFAFAPDDTLVYLDSAITATDQNGATLWTSLVGGLGRSLDIRSDGIVYTVSHPGIVDTVDVKAFSDTGEPLWTREYADVLNATGMDTGATAIAVVGTDPDAAPGADPSSWVRVLVLPTLLP
ncbi:Molybdopterin oxidoreductase, iron-sulfur binding subunit [Enhygromyxa salina]|uniref:Molybdopterin oxidoreductase, iron-sulfur binding subunit n=1 Tax=Enhygromyxa salina TaxID=215803 RepID=A0A0C2CVD6_9BACT|nr:Molybdopterin oxidoreductase, iron-sulfur binding subunit [Enhygromyxa salina]